MAEQGVGQIALLTSARDNHWVLNDPETPESVKEKVHSIERYKQYFEDYWDYDTGRIYTRTTFLDSDAVTYLLVASPHDRVMAKNECFPITGCFPYLGFFHRASVESWAKSLQAQGHITHIRPVYAYSTLGYFSDTILSSFFFFEDFELAELIFHELFHTMFFPRNEVALNEALATYFGREMAFEYFDYDSSKREKRDRQRNEMMKISRAMSSAVQRLNESYEKASVALERPLEVDESRDILKSFLESDLRPYFEQLCNEHNISSSNCYPLSREWNNASLAAFATYRDHLGPIEDLREELNVDIKGLFRYIQQRHRDYLRKDKRWRETRSFSDFLFADS